nr:hypothetical protein [Candidatus Sigynarchaeota archaeon]
DPGFTTGAKSVASTIQESVLDIKFLGGSDTTNVVLKFSIPEHPGLDFVLKFYPRVAFNTARFLNDLLAKARFRSFARLLASCDYQVSALQSMFRSAGDGTFFDEIERTTSSMNIPVNRFFPFMHIISFIPGVGDGGLPFWNSAIETPARENGVDQDILDLAAKLGKTIVGFHDALEEKSKQPALQDEQQRTAMIAAIKSQLSVARSFLADYASKIPENLAGTWSDLGEKLDFDAISKRAIPSFEEIRDTPRQYIHQDLHMGQLMYIDRLKEFLILDLEGDPQLPWRERIESYHVEKDLASLVRSLSYIKIAVIKTILEKKFTNIEEYILNFKVLFPLLFLFTSRTPGFLLPGIDPSIESEIQHLVKVLNDWEEQVRKTILSTYQQQREINLKLIEFYTLQRIMNEITYEIKFRPSNFFIPLIGLLELVS